jgi:hypothetical protein
MEEGRPGAHALFHEIIKTEWIISRNRQH